MSDNEVASSASRSVSPKSSKKGSKKHSPSRSLSRSQSLKRQSKSASSSAVSRSRSPSERRTKRRSDTRSRSRSRSYDRRRSSGHSREYDDRRGDRRPHQYDRRHDDHRSAGRGGNDYGRSRSRSPMSHRRRHLGDRENPETSRCIGVFGLSLSTQERELRDVFERYGPIEDLQIVYDHQTGRSRGFAFLYFRNLADAVEAKDSAPGQEIDGRKIRVDYSITKRAHTPTPGVYLGRPIESSHHHGGRERRSRSPVKQRGGGGRYSRSGSRDRSYSARRY